MPDTARWSECSEASDDLDPLCYMGVLHGLKARSDLNGKLARAVKYVQSKGRWALIVEGGEKVRARLRPFRASARARKLCSHVATSSSAVCGHPAKSGGPRKARHRAG